MVKLLSLLITLSMPSLSWAAPCQAPGVTVGWAQSFYGTSTVNGFIYDQQNQILYVSLIGGTFNDFLSVPFSVAQQFTVTQNADVFFRSRVNGQFPEALLTQACGLMLTESGGYLRTY